MRVSEDCRNDMLDTLIIKMNSGYLRVYSGTRPTGPDTALSGNTMLSEHTLSSTSAAAADGGVLTLNSIADDASANATGTATFARVFEDDGTTALFDLSVGESSAEVVLDETSITAGDKVSITSLTLTLPMGS